MTGSDIANEMAKVTLVVLVLSALVGVCVGLGVDWLSDHISVSWVEEKP